MMTKLRTVELRQAQNDVLSFVGDTPMVKLSVPGEETPFGNLQADLYAKLEYFNPSGSMKDRITKYMIEQAEKRGDLKKGYTIVEATSGNTGISFAMMGAIMGYKVVIVMPETMTKERQQFMHTFGAEVVLTPGGQYVKGSVEKAKELAKQPGWWMASQFENFDNVTAHEKTTGLEILEQVPGGRVDAFVSGVGTGGTIMGVGKALREVNPRVKIIAAQPASSQELTGGKAGGHRIEGIADGFVPKIVDNTMIDETISVKDEDAIFTVRLLHRRRGLLCGISSGCNVFAALRVARKLRKGQVVVTLLPDSADRYMSIGLADKKDEEIPVSVCG